MGDFAPDRGRAAGGRPAIPLPRTSRIIAGFLVAGVIGLTAYFLPVLQSSTTPVVSSGGGILNPIAEPTTPFTVLLLGSDDDSKFAADQYNTQSMILVRVDPTSKQVTMLSIPRDLWVPIAGRRGLGKIDTAYQTGGVDAAIATVQQNFQVHIDDYVWIGLKGLIKLIDTMGGVNLIVTNPVMDDFYPADINTSSPYGYYRIALLPGPVHLDGVHSLQYVRSRHGDLRGDFARSERQQELLLAMKAQAKHLNIANLPDLASAMNGEVKTSISLQRMRELFSVLDQYNGSGVHRVLLDAPYTSEGFAGGQSVVFANWGLILPLVHQSFPPVKAITYSLLLLAMVAFGFGVYRATGVLKTESGHVVRPTLATAPALPGTMYVAQQGALYRFKGGTFTQITDAAGWTQPSVSQDGSQLVAVMRHENYSDVYTLASSGRIIQRLTHHQSPEVEANHWSFLPRFSADRSHIFYSYDLKDPFTTYRVDLAIFALADDGSGAVLQWTVPNGYTGGDMDPLPLPDGGLIYTKYSIDEHDNVHSQVWFVPGPGQAGRAVTQPDENCAQPALSPDQKALAMICRHDQMQSTDLVVAPLDRANMTLGPEAVLVHGQLSASPVFSPDGQTIAFLAPVQPGEAFQLWTVPAAASATSPPAANPITQNLGLDSSAPPAWIK